MLFQHAMRYGWATSNPMRLVRQSAMPLQEEIVLTPVEIAALLEELRDPFRALVLLAAVTGLRRGELFGVKWEDIDFTAKEIRIVRSVVDQVEGPPKTLASRRPLPMSSESILIATTMTRGGVHPVGRRCRGASFGWIGKPVEAHLGDPSWVSRAHESLLAPYGPTVGPARHMRTS